MNRLTLPLALAALLAGSAAIADDTMSHATMTPHQSLKDCIEKQKTVDLNMSNAQMKRLCKDKLKAQKAAGDMPEQPPTDAPHN
jgi:hypothetical protein